MSRKGRRAARSRPRLDSRAAPRQTVTPRAPVSELRRAWRAREGRACVVLETNGYRKWCWLYRGRTYHVHVQEAGTRFEVMPA